MVCTLNMLLSPQITEDPSTTALDWLSNIQRTKDKEINLKMTILLSYESEIMGANNWLLKI